MYEKFIVYLSHKMAQKQQYEVGSDEYQIMRYGLELFTLLVGKSLLLFIVSLLLGVLAEILLLIVLLTVLRHYAAGIHLKNNFVCTLIGFVYFIGGAFIAKNHSHNYIFSAIAFCICFFLNYLYAPSPTENRPMTEQQKAKFKKRTLIAIVVLYIGTIIMPYPTIQNLLVISVLIATATILPITYKIFGERRINYAE